MKSIFEGLSLFQRIAYPRHEGLSGRRVLAVIESDEEFGEPLRDFARS
jgi:hypothetical protein